MFVNSVKLLLRFTPHILPLLAAGVVILLPSYVFAQYAFADLESQDVLRTFIKETSLLVAYVAGTIIIILTIFSLLIKEPTDKLKHTLFYIFAFVTLFPTLYFASGTIYINVTSESKGPVHWHLDFEIYNCGERVKLAPPSGFLSNKVGSSDFHHHDDNRIHVEGVVDALTNFELEKFFKIIGGELTSTSFTIPTKDGVVVIQNGDQCKEVSGTWQAFLYEVVDIQEGVVRRSKMSGEFPHHLLKPEIEVPPGDCVIFEFGPSITMTERVCTFYEIGLEKGELILEN